MLVSLSVYAQIGINTESPQGLFHIDSNGDTNNNLNTSDDVVITNDPILGLRLGVGLLNPMAVLDILSPNKGEGLRINTDANISGNVLTSDVDGYAEWKTPGVSSQKMVFASDPNFKIAVNNPSLSSGFISTGSYIEIPPGKVYVFGTLTLSVNTPSLSNQTTGLNSIPLNNPIWVSFALVDGLQGINTTSLSPSSDVLTNGVSNAGTWISGSCYSIYTILSGGFAIENKTKTKKTYTLAIGNIHYSDANVEFIAPAQGLFSQDNIIALSIK